MLGYWIETSFFATRIGDFTPEEHILFCKLCQSEAEGDNDFLVENERTALVFSDYTQTWEKYKSDIGSENGFWEEVENDEPLHDSHTLVKLIPEDAIKICLGKLPSCFFTKLRRFMKIKDYTARNKRNPIFQKNSATKDWNLLNGLLKLAKAARENYSGKQEQRGEPTGETTQPAVANIMSADELRTAVYEGILMANNAEPIEKWHILSKTKYGGKGWADIAKTVLESEQKKLGQYGKYKEPSPIDIDKKATEIRRAVKKHRNRLLGIDAEEDQDDWDFL